MSRQIKFRAWNPEDLFMFYEGYSDGREYNGYYFDDNQVKAFTSIRYDDLEPLDCKNFDCIVMQFTGRKDKNDKEIYEGDIVRRKRFPASEDFVGAVEYSDEVAAFVIVPNITLIEDLLSRATDVEVIGNIYETPELLTNLPTQSNG